MKTIMDKIKAVMESYRDVVQYFSKEKIETRYNALYKTCKTFVEAHNFSSQIMISELSLMHATMDYFTDIYRLKTFHNIEFINNYKIISYSAFWLTKRKPLQVIDANNDNEFLTFINEALGVSYIYTELVSSLPSDFSIKLQDNTKKSINGFIESLFYYFNYRTYTAQDLEMCILFFISGLLIGQAFPSSEFNFTI